MLNLFWLVVTAMLFVAAMRASTRGQLRCTLAVAFACTALLALVLFPALSMTDDLQRAKLDVETSSQHLGNSLLLGLLQDGEHLQPAFLSALLLVMVAAAQGRKLGWLTRLTSPTPKARISGTRPDAVRPPPAFSF